MSGIGAEVRIWALPIAACAVVGVVAWATIGWRVGVVPLVLAAAASAFLYALRHRGVQAWREHYAQPQRRTGTLLRGPQRKGHRVLHGCALPEDELDHLVVGPNGVYALQSARFQSGIPMRTMYQDLFHGPEPKGHVLDRAGRQADQVASALGDSLRERVHVTPAVVVHGADVPWKVLTLRGVDVLPGGRLRRYINRPDRTARPGLTAVEIERITVAAEEALPPRSEETVGRMSDAARRES